MNKYFRFIYILLFISYLTSYEKSNLNIVNFNIHGFGKIISGFDIKNKINLIVENISDNDIILIQENWKYFNLIKNKLINHQLFFSLEKKNIFSYPSGLLIGINDDINVIDSEYIFYNDCSGIIFNGSDCLASKGFIFSRIRYLDEIIDIYNTHLDSGHSKKDNKVRIKQLNSLKEYIINNSLNSNLIISGDFNMDYLNSEEIKEFQYDLNLDLVYWDDSYYLDKKVDYIFYKIKFYHDVKNGDIPNILYTLSDHPPMSMHLNFK